MVLLTITLLLTSLICGASFFAPIVTESTTYVYPDNFSGKTLQEAIGMVNDGDTITVRDGTYPVHLNVNKSITLEGWNKDSTILDGDLNGTVITVNADNVKIDKFTIKRGNPLGVRINYTSNCNVSHTVIKNNYHGIELLRSSHCTLRDNDIKDNTDNNFGVVGYMLEHYVHDIDVTNKVDGKPICYQVNMTGGNIPSDAGYVAIVNSTGVAAKNLYSLRSNRQGVLVAYSTEVVVENIRFVFPSDTCVELVNSTNSIVHNITVTDNWGISLSNSKSNIIKNNKMSSTGIGIQLSKSDYNNITDNMIVNSGSGIILTSSINNTIVGNTVSNSYVCGIALQFGSNNSAIFHNNFLYNSPNQVIIWESFDNKFDNVFEGNYWSDYTSNYPDAKERNGTGIWDTPYQIDSLNQDNCPLMEPWSTYREFKRPMKIEKQLERTHRLYTYSNSTLASFAFSRFESKAIGFFTVSKGNISLKATAGYDGFLNITISRNWLDGPFTVLIDNKEVDYLMAVNTTHTSIYITYEKGSHAIQIKGVEAGDIFCDVNGDGKIDITDIATVIANYGSLEKT